VTPALDPALSVRPVPIERTRELRQAILRPHQTLSELAQQEVPGTFAVGAFRGARLVAVGMITPGDPPDGWRVRGMATLPARRGRGAGTAVLGRLLEHARERGARAVWCYVRTPARRLYERAGFVVDSEEFELPEIGPHLVMRLTLD